MEQRDTEKKYFEIQRIYIKDASFEAPNTPIVFSKNWNPNINLDVNIMSKKLEIDIFEVILKVQVIVKIKDQLVFLCDVHQAGIFFVTNLNEKMLEHCLGAYCPSILFPYARECISNLVSHASFPQLNLSPINFDSIYFNNLKDKKKCDK